MAPPRQLRHSLLARLIARITILALVAGLLPADARASASVPASPSSIASYILPDLTPEEPASVGDILVCVVVFVVTDPSALTKSAFGELLAHTGQDPQPYAFTGEPLDPNSGWQYHRARWMDPRAGRFVGVDPWKGSIFEPHTLHRYAYVGGSPVDRVDPTGRFEGLGGLQISVAINSIISGISGLNARGVRGLAEGLIKGAVIGLAFAGIGAVISEGASLFALARGAANAGAVAVDTNVLIAGLEGGEIAAVDAALAGRAPLIPIQVAKEFLRGGGDLEVLRRFLIERGGRVGAAATAEVIESLQGQAVALGRVLRAADAAVGLLSSFLCLTSLFHAAASASSRDSKRALS